VDERLADYEEELAAEDYHRALHIHDGEDPTEDHAGDVAERQTAWIEYLTRRACQVHATDISTVVHNILTYLNG
jgi:hypothetical protein